MQQYHVVGRTSRFSVIVRDDTGTHVAHLTNSGRLKDLIYPGNRCLCIPKKTAKTTLRLVGAGISQERVILVDPHWQARCFLSAACSDLIPWLSGWDIIRSEVPCGESRIDYMIKRGDAVGYMEIKSAAMLLRTDAGSFPDCPTTRGRKHMQTMRRLAETHRSIVLFLVQHPDALVFSPNADGDPLFAEALSLAAQCGVEIRAIKMCLETDGSVMLEDPDLGISGV